MLHPATHRLMLRCGSALALLLGTTVARGQGTALTYPRAPRDSLVERIHDVAVADPYRWLEQLNDSAVIRFAAAQDSLALQTIRTDPGYAQVRELVRTRALRGASIADPAIAGGRIFLWRTTRDSGGQLHANLFVRDGLSGRSEPLLHGASISPGQVLTYIPSPDGSLIAVGARSAPGTSWMRWYLIDVPAGTVRDSLDGAFFGSTLAWTSDGRTLFYERFDTPDSANLTLSKAEHPRLARHEVGQLQASDAVVVAGAAGGSAGDLVPTVSDDGRYLIVVARIGDGQAVLLGDLHAPRPHIDSLVARTSGASFAFLGNAGPALWFQTNVGASRGRIVQITVGQSRRAQWHTLVAERSARMLFAAGGQAGPSVVGDRFVVPYRAALHTTLAIFDFDGRQQRSVAVPSGGWMFASGGGNPLIGTARDSIGFFRYIGITSPIAIYAINPHTGGVSLWEKPELPFDPEAYVTERVYAQSADGTRVPMTLTHKKGLRRDGHRPVLVEVYGAYGFDWQPYYQPHFIGFMDLGGVVAFASVRGGGEYGEPWHVAAIKTTKQRSVDDVAASVRWLTTSGWTSAAKIAVNGTSAGGALVAAYLTQRPRSVGAVLADYPLTDLVRYLQLPGQGFGAEEFGSPDVPAEFTSLRALSPYHNVRSNVCYPSTLILTSDTDNQAPPMHAYKFAAALQHAQSCSNPVLLEVVWGSGHSAFGSAARPAVETFTDQLAFLVRALGMKPDT